MSSVYCLEPADHSRLFEADGDAENALELPPPPEFLTWETDSGKAKFESDLVFEIKRARFTFLHSLIDDRVHLCRRQLIQLSHRLYVNIVRAIPRKREAEKIIELLNLLCNVPALVDLLHLRLTCKCCEAERRFPVICHSGRSAVLEVHLIEQFIGGDISYYVPTSAVDSAICICAHCSND